MFFSHCLADMQPRVGVFLGCVAPRAISFTVTRLHPNPLDRPVASTTSIFVSCAQLIL